MNEVIIDTYQSWQKFIWFNKDYDNFLELILGTILFDPENLIFLCNSVFGTIADRNIHIFYREHEIKIYYSNNIHLSDNKDIQNLIILCIPEFCQIFWSIINNKIPIYSKQAIDICNVLIGVYLEDDLQLFRGTILFRDFFYHMDNNYTFLGLIPINNTVENLILAANSWRRSIF